MLTVLVYMTFGIAIMMIVGYYISTPAYSGQQTDHFNGKRFYNIGGIHAKGLADVFKWMLARKRGEWKMREKVIQGIKPREKVENGMIITFINHSTFLIQLKGMNILLDPVWSNRASPFQWIGPKRIRPPGIAFNDLPKIDVILLSHNHYDHLDLPTMKKITSRFHPKIFTPLGVKSFLDKNQISGVTDMDWWETIDLTSEIKLSAVPAQHFSGRGFFDRDTSLWCGFVLMSDQGNVYFAGDSGYNQSLFEEIGIRYAPIRIAILPIGAYKPRWFMSPIHTSPEEAVQIHLDVIAETSIASHFGTFPLADEGRDEPRQDLIKAMQKLNVAPESFLVLQEGFGKEF